MSQEIYGYHANEEASCRNFIGAGSSFCMIVAGDETPWLGHKAMYFWDNLGNARWWRIEKKGGQGWIVRALIDISALLDLTDTDVIKKIEGLWADACLKKMGKCNGVNIDEDTPLGMKLDILYLEWPILEETYPVIKCLSWTRRPIAPLFRGNSRITNTGMVQYAARSTRVILSREKVE